MVWLRAFGIGGSNGVTSGWKVAMVAGDVIGDLLRKGGWPIPTYKEAHIREQLWWNIGENNARGVIRLVTI